MCYPASCVFYTDEINSLVVRETNREAQRCLAEQNCSQYLRDRWHNVSEVEMRAFVGLLIEAGVMRNGGRFLGELFDERHGSPLFKSTMSQGRFHHILRFVRFDDKLTRA